MGKTHVVKMVVFYHPWQDTDTWGKSYWRVDRTAEFHRSDGSCRVYGGRIKGVFDDGSVSVTRYLSHQQWQRLHTLFNRLRRRKDFREHSWCEYKPRVWWRNNYPYYHLNLERG